VIAACRVELARVRDHLEEQGVSVDVVYSLDAIERGLTRLERLLPDGRGRQHGPRPRAACSSSWAAAWSASAASASSWPTTCASWRAR
jgi:site-specific recombinase